MAKCEVGPIPCELVRRSRQGGALLTGVLLSFAALAGGCAAAPPALAQEEFHGPAEPAKAPKGVKLAIVSCSATLKRCQIPAEAAVEAAKALGWEAAIFDGRANPKLRRALCSTPSHGARPSSLRVQSTIVASSSR